MLGASVVGGDPRLADVRVQLRRPPSATWRSCPASRMASSTSRPRADRLLRRTTGFSPSNAVVLAGELLMPLPIDQPEVDRRPRRPALLPGGDGRRGLGSGRSTAPGSTATSGTGGTCAGPSPSGIAAALCSYFRYTLLPQSPSAATYPIETRVLPADFLSAPGEIRTPDLRFRRPTLYPAELRAPMHFLPVNPALSVTTTPLVPMLLPGAETRQYR